MQIMEEETNIEKKPVRVLQIIGIVCGGGVEAVIMNYYRNMDRQKIQFDFVVDGFEKTALDDEVEAMGGTVYHVTPYQKNILGYMRDISKIIQENRYMIVHSNMNTMSAFPLFVAWMHGVPTRILHNHSMAVSGEGLRTVMKTVLRPFAKLFANRYLACSMVSGEWMYGRSNMAQGKVKIIRNAIEIDKFVYHEGLRNTLREKLSIPHEAFVIGHVGRFAFQKNHAFLLDVFSEIHKIRKDSILVLVGDGELKSEIEEKAKKLNIEKHIRFLGLRKDVAELYNVMDVFVLPSWYEGLPVVAVEAQANGLTCLLSDRIAKESKITHHVEFLKLEIGAKAWADRILSAVNRREDGVEEKLEVRGFSVEKEADALTQDYLSV